MKSNNSLISLHVKEITTQKSIVKMVDYFAISNTCDGSARANGKKQAKSLKHLRKIRKTLNNMKTSMRKKKCCYFTLQTFYNAVKLLSFEIRKNLGLFTCSKGYTVDLYRHWNRKGKKNIMVKLFCEINYVILQKEFLPS